MAEVLGVVASGIAVADAAGNIGSGIIKLQRLWKEVKDVPDTINSLMQQLEVLVAVIGDMETMYQSNNGDVALRSFNSQGIQLSMARCREAMNTLENLVAQLTQHVDSQKRLKRAKAKLKVVLGKNDLDQCQRRLSNAVQLLQIAQGCYQMSLNGAMLQQLITLPTLLKIRPEPNIKVIKLIKVESQLESQDRDRKSLETRKTDNLEAKSGVILGQKVSWMQSWGKVKRSLGPFASYGWNSSETKDRKSGFVRKNFHFRFEMAQWLSGKAWEIQFSRAMSGWDHHLKIYNVVPKDSEIIRCARNRDLNRIKYLFENNLASIYDRDIKGRSLLYHAVIAWERGFYDEDDSAYELAKFLQKCGLDIAEDCQSFYSPFMLCSSYPSWEKYSSWLFTSWQTSKAADDLDVADLTKVLGRPRYATYPAFAAFQPTVQPRFYEVPLIERATTWLCCDLFDDRLFRNVVRKTGIIMKSDAVELAERDINLLSLATCSFFRNRFVSGYNQRRWDQFMHDLVLTVGNVNLQQEEHSCYDIEGFHYGLNSGNPLMVCILTAAYIFLNAKHGPPIQSFEKHLHTEVIKWLQILQGCNIDLESYGQHEHSMIFRKDSKKRVLGSQTEAWAWKGFSWGPNPSDWVFDLDRVVERFSGNFWWLIDNPIQQVPGAWIDNDNDYPISDGKDLYPDSSESEAENHSEYIAMGDAYY